MSHRPYLKPDSRTFSPNRRMYQFLVSNYSHGYGYTCCCCCCCRAWSLKGGGGTLKLCVVKFGLLKRGVGTLICGREMLMCGMLTCGRGMLICGMLTGPAQAAPTDADANVPTMATSAARTSWPPHWVTPQL